ncbi:hypothetical protein F5884DRAFT_798070 [Xylogone sp. PMI_703]|nr:hypothetical protein F5884DRAFT_798070 [Xylogone sp. PMI_703]
MPMPHTESGRNNERRRSSVDLKSMWFLKKLFGRHHHEAPRTAPAAAAAAAAATTTTAAVTTTVTSPQEPSSPRRAGVVRRLSRKVVPGLPRAGTFRRQQSELRERLEPVKPHPEERRAVSEEHRRNPVRSSAEVGSAPRQSAPDVLGIVEATEMVDVALEDYHPIMPVSTLVDDADQGFVEISNDVDVTYSETQSVSSEGYEDMIADELERRWILNLSMHFRDKSRREKFFVTYAETPTHWRRVTISLDYRHAPPHSLEEELLNTKFQRDKSARIYEAIRDSLQDIQFYDTVTNLKLQTENDRLHVHVVEDLSEIIAYPPIKSINHLKCRRVREDQLVFDSHLSGFVYKVTLDNQVFIKKEIPGPDTVDEFLYEINALHRLSGSRSVIQFGGVVVDKTGEHVKGLLISFAEQGALIDVIYDGEGKIPWSRRERWAKQIVQGLSEIHEAGFVQGDFTLSNIVVDEYDNAKIIDINRRGCPVGWEPPEVTDLIDSNQRISMYIGVKSDLYQLGMVLYALAFQEDEPENHRPFNLDMAPKEVPDYYLDLCRRCLGDDPRNRLQASVLLSYFPEIEEYYHLERSAPLIVDAPYIDEGTRANGYYTPSSMNDQLPSHHPHPLGSLYGTRPYAQSLLEDPPDFPRRGRSPARAEPAAELTDPAGVPLPASSEGSQSTESLPDNLPTEQSTPRGLDSPPKNPLRLNPYRNIQSIHSTEHDTLETTPRSEIDRVPRSTAAAISASEVYTKDLPELAGVGEVHKMDFPLPLIPLDDDLTTETHNDRILLKPSVGG